MGEQIRDGNFFGFPIYGRFQWNEAIRSWSKLEMVPTRFRNQRTWNYSDGLTNKYTIHNALFPCSAIIVNHEFAMEINNIWALWNWENLYMLERGRGIHVQDSEFSRNVLPHPLVHSKLMHMLWMYNYIHACHSLWQCTLNCPLHVYPFSDDIHKKLIPPKNYRSNMIDKLFC